ncbi:hypothetical protein L484_026103 [Morus notabilis]|uniref:Uncharacterized protein n=1 Tax=Morus notabilis TaxID=981085 RepID=W9R841_9ROSA|nr:hypothetical protein L484_026103 [Morus notabilis]
MIKQEPLSLEALKGDITASTAPIGPSKPAPFTSRTDWVFKYNPPRSAATVYHIYSYLTCDFNKAKQLLADPRQGGGHGS